MAVQSPVAAGLAYGLSAVARSLSLSLSLSLSSTAPLQLLLPLVALYECYNAFTFTLFPETRLTHHDGMARRALSKTVLAPSRSVVDTLKAT